MREIHTSIFNACPRLLQQQSSECRFILLNHGSCANDDCLTDNEDPVRGRETLHCESSLPNPRRRPSRRLQHSKHIHKKLQIHIPFPRLGPMRRRLHERRRPSHATGFRPTMAEMETMCSRLVIRGSTDRGNNPSGTGPLGEKNCVDENSGNQGNLR